MNFKIYRDQNPPLKLFTLDNIFNIFMVNFSCIFIIIFNAFFLQYAHIVQYAHRKPEMKHII